jgi:hypothetical protein
VKDFMSKPELWTPEEKEYTRAMLRHFGVTHPDELPEIEPLDQHPVLGPLLFAANREDPAASPEEVARAFFERTPATCKQYEDYFQVLCFVACARVVLQEEIEEGRRGDEQ